MEDKNKSVSGVIVPIITPVDSDGNVEVAELKKMIDHLLNAGVDGIFVGGSAGMGPLLKDDQWKVLSKTAYDYVDGRCILFGGAISTSTARAIDKIRFLEDCGYKYVAVTPTYYITLARSDQFLAHFKACKAATSMDMVVYNIPSCTGSSIPVEVLEELAAEGLYSVLKESSGDKEYFEKVIAIGKKYGLSILQGNEPDIEWGFKQGAKGIVPVCANYEPATYVSACKAAVSGDDDILHAAQERANSIRDTLLVNAENWIAGIMYGLKSLGIGNGIPICPLQEISENSKSNIDKITLVN
ncbi:MAG: dihydrodipicolinate synthase family protein [Sedimentisphaeraceae bacterium JB056]